MAVLMILNIIEGLSGSTDETSQQTTYLLLECVTVVMVTGVVVETGTSADMANATELLSSSSEEHFFCFTGVGLVFMKI